MKRYSTLLESLPAKTVVFAFGRFNPPTTGHELLVRLVKKVAQSNSADYAIYASATQDKKKNPLSADRKLHYLNLMFPNTHFYGAGGDQRTFIEVAKHLNKKYKNLIMVAGSDRVPEYQKLLDKYNGVEFQYDSIKVVSAGERDPDADDASGMSASKMRAAASKGDFETFQKGLPNTIRNIDARRLMNEIRVGMGLAAVKEQVKFEFNALREAYIKGEIFNVGDLVECAGSQYEVIDRGANYLTVVDKQGQTHRKWLHECTVVGVVEDIQPGYAPEEISFKGYTTKNLHHSEDAVKAFQGTIERYGKSEPATVLSALKATDAYMKLNDMHLEQGKAPDDQELKVWRDAHGKARDSLNRIGEFLHHQDYWHMHEHEIQDMETKYTPATAGAEMSDSYQPDQELVEDFTKMDTPSLKKWILTRQRNAMGGNLSKQRRDQYDQAHAELKKRKANEELELDEGLTDKTIKSSDKIKVARVIADMLGVENAESMTPEAAVNAGLRNVKNKRMTPEMVGVVKKMLALAQEVGIKVNASMVPQAVSEDVVNPDSTYNVAKDILRYKDFLKLSKMNKGVVPELKDPTEVGHSLHTDDDGDDDQVRRMKVRYKTEEAEIEEDVATADYKVSSTGRKYRAHRVRFANSDDNADPIVGDDDQTNASTSKRVKNKPLLKKIAEQADEEHDITESDIDNMVDSVDDIEDVLDLYDDGELVIADSDTGEIVDHMKEEVEHLTEVLSRIERMRAKMRFARTQAKRERRLQVVLKQRSSSARINSRARRLAINLMKQRIMRKPAAQLSVPEKERVEAIIARRKAVINRLAMKLAPRIRKIESERLSHAKVTK